MGKRGQTTIIFIILIPVFLVLTAFIIDTGINMYNEKKLKNVTEDIMEVLIKDEIFANFTYENRDETVAYLTKTANRLYMENNIDTEYLYINVLYSGSLEISNIHKYYSFMNSLFNKGNGLRQISIDMEGRLYNDELIIEYKDGNDENK